MKFVRVPSCRYQNADWRSRPLPEEMIKYCAYELYHGFLFCCVGCWLLWSTRFCYCQLVVNDMQLILLLSRYAREDTHYLLYIYDLMKQRLQRESTTENDLLLEVKLFFFCLGSHLICWGHIIWEGTVWNCPPPWPNLKCSTADS